MNLVDIWIGGFARNDGCQNNGFHVLSNGQVIYFAGRKAPSIVCQWTFYAPNAKGIEIYIYNNSVRMIFMSFIRLRRVRLCRGVQNCSVYPHFQVGDQNDNLYLC